MTASHKKEIDMKITMILPALALAVAAGIGMAGPAHAEDDDFVNAPEVGWSPEWPGQSRPAGGCTNTLYTWGDAIRPNIMENFHTISLKVAHKDCDNFDIAENYEVRIKKEDSDCGNSVKHVENYEVNPNSLAYDDRPNRLRECLDDERTIYTLLWQGPFRINSNDPKNERCIGAHFKADIRGSVLPALDVEETIPSVCFNGL